MKDQVIHELYMRRCFELAQKAGSETGENPKVGAVLVFENEIIGQGYHEKYGGPHAEVNAIHSVPEDKWHLIEHSAIYSSLEPCNHYGKTPPCTKQIIDHKIKKVYISALDPNPQMKGKSVGILRDKGIEVYSGILQEEGEKVIEPFLINHRFARPYIILKFAQSADGFMGKEDHQFWFSNHASDILVHKWRSEINGIMVGTNTAILDNPKLTTRLYPGNTPLRIFIDRQGRIPLTHHLFTDEFPSLIFTEKHTHKAFPENKVFTKINFDENILSELLKNVYDLGVTVLMIEGGAQLLQSIIDQKLWDEARIFLTPHILDVGIKAPIVKGQLIEDKKILDDRLIIISNPKC